MRRESLPGGSQVCQKIAELLSHGWKVYAIDEIRVEHGAETLRIWLPRGQRTKVYVDLARSAQLFFGILSLTSKRKTYTAFTSRTFDYDFEHVPITPSQENLV
ncbi:hypothetical protein BKH06_08920 [Actinomyces naeslundii]|uniref:hypothetical protein n=1 Tax=Actinomyces naeslundii TaxID=1655 RepID=UPI00096C9047|nr:hypothetical protein [Actinomyces naeslundii]OMG10320.1 hypothetical protein BKH06_08920 [Actinomyces naeslundii]